MQHIQFNGLIMKRILINANQQEELRVAIVNSQKLIDLDIEIPSSRQKKGNIYKGSIARVEPSLNASFVDYGGARHGFLPFKEIDRSGLDQSPAASGSASFQHLKEGQQVLVQVEREERGTKGAALTTYISLAGRYLVLMPNHARTPGVSRRIQGSKRDEAREILEQITLQKDEGLIVRTAGVDRDQHDLQWDLDYLRKLWTEIVQAIKDKPAPFLVYQESNVVLRSMRDHFKSDTAEVVIDRQEVYENAKKFVKMVMPTYANRLHLYDGSVPIFSHYQIEEKIETAYQHEVGLASGGALVFDHTEALLSIDINSGKATRGRDIEETALAINLEACEEIALQLRLRDAGGLIVIDFIDMLSNTNQRKVENALADATTQDRARVQIGRISRFGLLEMSRQRLRPSLGDVSYITCPRCNGSGNIRTLKSSAVSVLRMVENEAGKEKTGRVVAHLPLDVTSYLLNEKRKTINDVSDRYNVQITIVPDIRMETPHFQISRYRIDDEGTRKKASYEFHTSRESLYHNSTMRPVEKKLAQHVETAAVAAITPDRPAPTASMFKKFFRSLFTFQLSAKPAPTQKPAVDRNRQRRRRSNNPPQRGKRRNSEYGSSQRQSHTSNDSRNRLSQRRAAPEKAAHKPAAGSQNRPAAGSQNRPAAGSQNRPAASNQDRPAASNQDRPAASNQDRPTASNQAPAEKAVSAKYSTEQYAPPDRSLISSKAPAEQETSRRAANLSKPVGLTQIETKQRQ